ncbi:MAG: AarF/UbiB family protein [Patescibacteria group bacterium]
MVWRYAVVLRVFFSYGFLFLRRAFFGKGTYAVSPQALRETLEALGGSFLKFGQLAAVRPDFFPEEYCREFLKLLDEVPPIAPHFVDEIFLQEFGRMPEEIFASFNRTPFAAASFGQVHEAYSAEGEKIAVKIQRPFAAEEFSADARFFSFLGWLISKTGIVKAIDPQRAVREFVAWTWRELDYRKEAGHLERLGTIARKNKFPLRIPRVLADYSTSRVLAMEFIEGESLKRYYAAGTPIPEGNEFFRTLTFFELYSFLFEGFFHADPHPANIFVSPRGTPGVVDAGLVAEITVADRKRMGRFFRAVVKEDREAALEMFLQMVRTPILEILGEAKERYPKHWLKFQFLKSIFIGKVKTGLEDLMERWHRASREGGSLEERSPIHKMMELVALAERVGVKMPDASIVFIRTFFSIDVAALELAPEFNIPETVKEFFRVYEREFELLEREPDEVPAHHTREFGGEGWAQSMREAEREQAAAERQLLQERASAIMERLE